MLYLFATQQIKGLPNNCTNFLEDFSKYSTFINISLLLHQNQCLLNANICYIFSYDVGHRNLLLKQEAKIISFLKISLM